MTAASRAASAAVWAMGPAVSWLWLIGTMWVRGMSPRLGFSPTPVHRGGQVTEPSVSLPTAAAASPAATAAALPLEEPQALRSSA